MTEGNSDPTGGEDAGTQETGNQGGSSGTNWEAAYKGLQKKLSALQAQADLWKSERDDVTAQLSSSKADLTIANGKVDAFTSQVASFEGQVATLQGNFNAANGKLERTELIMSTYPDLAKFEAKGLLPQADTIDDLTTKLTDFREALGVSVTQSVDATLAGASLPQEESTGGDEGLSDDALRDKMMFASGRDPVEYARLQKIADARDV